MRKALLFALLVALFSVAMMFDVSEVLSLSGIQRRAAQLIDWRNQYPAVFALGFFLFYVAATAVSIPGAAVLTLAGGALFGLLQGVLLVSFASSLGALLAFLIARYLFADFIQSRYGTRLRAINNGIEKDGGFYLFSLRLVPIFPFFLINLLMALTQISAWTFYWVSQLGMLAATVVYVNAGTQLASVQSAADVLSFELILAFSLLGLLPLLARKSLRLVMNRRVYRRWHKPMRFDRNLIVVGAGAAGLVSSLIAATVRARVTLVEAHKMGGDCLNFGCVPSKTLIRGAKLAHESQVAETFGINTTRSAVDFPRLMQKVRAAIKTIEPNDSVERYTGLGVDVVQGRARLVDPWTVEITGADKVVERMTSRSIVIATGATPVVPPIAGIEDSGYLTTDTLWERFSVLDRVPPRMTILGGGPIGCELAQAMARLGSQVTVVEMLPGLVNNEDPDVAELVAGSLRKDGVTLLLGHRALRCENNAGERSLVVEHGQQQRAVAYDELLCAVGRKPRLAGLGLAELGVDIDRPIAANEFMETIYPNILVCGDAAGSYQFTHTAAHQAWYASVNALFGRLKRFRVDNRVIPRVTFTDPEVATVGLTERQAEQRGIDYELSRYQFKDLDRAIVDDQTEGFVKVLTATDSDKILGASIVGNHAGELLAQVTLAMRHNLGFKKLLTPVHPYPTYGEANKFVAGEWRRAHAPQYVLKWLERYHRWCRSGPGAREFD